MIREFDMAGVFIPALVFWVLAAMVVSMLIRRLLAAIGFYRLVWHRALFDLAVFVIVLGGVRALALNWTLS